MTIAKVFSEHVQRRADERVMPGYADQGRLFRAEMDALDRVSADVPDRELQQAPEGLRRFLSAVDQI